MKNRDFRIFQDIDVNDYILVSLKNNDTDAAYGNRQETGHTGVAALPINQMVLTGKRKMPRQE